MAGAVVSLGFWEPAGSVAASHVNDSGFWIVTRYLGLSVADGIKTWTLLSTIGSIVGFATVAAIWAVV